MEPCVRPRVKICCISSCQEARMAIGYGASALGLVSDMPSGPGVVPEERIAEIARIIPPGVSSFLLTSRQDVPSIVGQQKRTGVNTIQLCDQLLRGTYQELRDALPGVKLVQVIHVSEKSVEEAYRGASHADALLLDSGNPYLPVKELGGTGKTHDWSVSRRIRENVDIPVFLAGGLNPENVGEAIKEVGPFGVDVCSGVRRDGRLDETKLSQFFKAVQRQ